MHNRIGQVGWIVLVTLLIIMVTSCGFANQPTSQVQADEVLTQSKPIDTKASEPALSSANPEASSAVAPQEALRSVMLTIIGDDKHGTILPPTQLVVQDQTSVLELLIQLTALHGIELDYSGRGMTAYILGIGGLYQLDRGAKSGWLYRVNGVNAQKSAGTYIVQVGDSVEWLYTLDFGKDLELKP